ncbi:MAG: alkaline phosphatase PhoX [Pseudomonadota bacterium]
MTMDAESHEISFDEWDEHENPGPEVTEFDRVVDRAVSRRGFIGGGAVAAACFTCVGPAGVVSPAPALAASRLGFEAVAANTLDTVTVPKGYSWDILVKWGDPLWSNGLAFDQETRGTGTSQELAFGDNNDGMFLFSDGDRHVLAINNEYTNRSIIYGNRESKLPETADDVRKGKAAHGVSIVHVRERGGRWQFVKDSPYNRKITPDTPMIITGPARGHDLLKTAADPSGTTSLGTWNNCGSGRTPWGTYLACEENFNGKIKDRGWRNRHI